MLSARSSPAIIACRDQEPSSDSIDVESTPEIVQSSGDGGAELSDTEGFVSDVCQYCNSPELSDLLVVVRCCVREDEEDAESVGGGSNGDSRTLHMMEFHAHKFVLAKSSEFFRTILYSANWSLGAGGGDSSGDGRSVCELVEDEACFHCFEHFLRFLYAGRVFINRATAVGLLRLADKYQVWSLRQLTEQFMTQNAQPPNVRNAVLWYAWAKQLQLDRLATTCFNTVRWNARQAVELDEFLDIDVSFVRDLLRTSQLVMEDEFAVLQLLLLRWLGVGDRFARHIDQLLPMVRFPMMAAKQLAELETSELSQRPESSKLLTSLINKAYRFRALCPYNHELKQSEFTSKFYQPRSYLCLAVDNIKIGNTMRFGLQVDIRTQSGPVPSPIRDAEWKMGYQKQHDNWTFKLLSQDSSFACGTGVSAELVALCQNEAGEIVNYFAAKDFQFTRTSQSCQCQFDLTKGPGRRRDAKNLHILLKITAPRVASGSQ